MALFAISDLHLSLGTNKPMDIFSSHWEGHAEKIKANWENKVGEQDVVIIPGDISWGTYLEDAKEDFRFLSSLPGKKIISKGNHDYWWTTVSKMDRFMQENNFNNIYFLHNNYYTYQDWVICGTRGWSFCEKGTTGENEKIYTREQKRLELSLEEGKNSGKDKIIAVLHFPPFKCNNNEYDFLNIFKKHKVNICLYGHLHGDFSLVRQGEIEGIEFVFCSSDYLNFEPIKII